MALPAAGRTVWRITSSRYAERAFDGEGARLYGGRWNHPGTAVAYCSATLSLAVLEYFVHLEPNLAPPDLVAVAAELPAGNALETPGIEAPPPGWGTYPAPQKIGRAHRLNPVTPKSRIASSSLKKKKIILE